MADETGCFTFTWKIENFSVYLSEENRTLGSPVFKTEANGITWWKLDMVLDNANGDEFVKFVLRRIKGEPKNDRCKLSLFAICGEVPLNRVSSVTQPEFIRFSAEYSFKRSAIFGETRHLFLPQDTLTVRCKIWQGMMKPGQRVFRTVLHRANFLWNIERFNSAQFNTSSLYQQDSLQFAMKLSKSGSGTHKVLVDGLQTKDGWPSFVSCRLSILGGNGYVISHNDHFPTVSKVWDIEICAESITNNTLYLQLESTVAVEMASLEQPQLPSDPASIEDINASSQSSETSLESSSTLSEDLLILYKDRTFSDATLRTEDQSFAAHKSILCARSQVFRAMFESDQTTEGLSGVVNIKDLDSETLERMLVFLYSDSLEDLQWEEASALYYAADKYAIHPLKSRCLAVLKAGLAVSNACDAVMLADQHEDEQLMRCAMDFVRDHDEVISSAEWESLEDSNPRLTTKLIREMYLKKGKK